MSLKKHFKLLIYSTLIFSLTGIFFLSVVTYKELLPSFEKLSQKIIYSKHTKILIEQHNSIQNFIQFNEILLFKKLKEKLKEKVNFAYQIAYTIFEKNINNPDKERIKGEIKRILRNLRFNNGRGYFFIFDVNGKRILYPLKPEKEGENILNLRDASGNFFIKKMIKLVLLKKQGFYEYVRPHPFKKDKFYKKISFIKLFEPFNWIIGAGDYYIDFLNEVKTDVIYRLQLFSIPDNMGFYVFDNKRLILEKNFYKIKIPLNKSGLNNTKDYLFYITFLPELKWKLVTVLNKKAVFKEIEKLNKELSYILRIIIGCIFLGIILVLGFLFYIFNKLENSISNEFLRFKKLFKKIPIDFRRINEKNLKFEEFKELAKYANEMSEMLRNSFLEIKKEKNYLEIITENSGMGIAIINKEKEIEFFNTELKKMIDFNDIKERGKFYNLFKLKNCLGYCEKDSENCVVSNVLKKKRPFVSQNESIVTYKGEEIPVFLIINPIVSNDKVDKVVVILRDISQERIIKNELLKLKSAIEQAPISIVITDINGTIEFVNPFFCKITGYTFEEAIGNNSRILKTKYNEKFHKDLWETILSGNVWEGEFLNRKKNGEVYWEKAIISPVFDENNKIINFVAVKQDITELKNLQKKLITAKEQAELANKIKSEFIASMSHEIRTPMNAILGFIELLYETSLSELQKKYIDIIKSSSENLLKILNDILDLSKVEAGKFEFEEMEFNLEMLVNNCINIFSKKAGEKGLFLKYEIDKDIPQYLKGDVTRISQIINNLLSNAIKFTDKGEVGLWVKLKSFDEVENTVEILFCVYDTGTGIEKEKINKIFEPFSQADSSITRQFGGTGLGLAIVSKIVKAYNGKLWVESEIGKGSEFYFTLKLPVGKEPSKQLKDSSLEKKEIISFKGSKVLVAEDNPTNQILIKEIFKKLNIEVEIAEDGIEALKKLSEKDFDLIFFDWHMPNMDGVEAIKILIKIENNIDINDKRIPNEIVEKLKNKKFTIIALTAAVMSNETKILKDAGFDEFLSKPIIKEELIGILKKYLKRVEATEREDLRELMNFIDNDKNLLKTLIESFKESFNANIFKIKQGIKENNFEIIKFASHSIKGAAYNIKLNKIGKIAEQIELAAKNNDIDTIKTLVNKMEQIQI